MEVPHGIDKLRAIMPKDLIETVDNLLKQKAIGDEKFNPKPGTGNDYIREQMAIAKKRFRPVSPW